MAFKLAFTIEARDQLKALQSDAKKLKRVYRCLGLIETNPKHPGLNSHKYRLFKGANDEDIWESYVENKTPTAWRVFWHYGPASGTITILAITEHP